MADYSNIWRRIRQGMAPLGIATLFYVAGLGEPVLAAERPTPLPPTTTVSATVPTGEPCGYILARLAEHNRELETYQAKVRVEFRLRSFPYIRQHLDGTAYFRRPSTYEVIFKRVPSYARGFGHLSADLADAGSWGKRFHVTVIGERDVAGRRDIVLRLVQRVRGQIDHQDVAVNPQLWEVDEMEYHYYNGGTVAMRQRFANIGGFRLIAEQDAQIQIPYVKAVAHAEYTDYHTNVAVQSAAPTDGGK